MHKKILNGLDGSDGAFKALKEAIILTKQFGAELHTISVEEMPQYAGTIGEVIEEKAAADGRFGEIARQAREMAKAENVGLKVHIIVGHEVKSIVEFIKEHGIDLLVIGFMGRSALYDRVMGSTCQSLVRLAPCSVLVVK
ncbi:MAG: universal stress protein [Syntrophales bacterium]|jgi:nucleotide-binding universal stress UspA family protein